MSNQSMVGRWYWDIWGYEIVWMLGNEFKVEWKVTITHLGCDIITPWKVILTYIIRWYWHQYLDENMILTMMKHGLTRSDRRSWYQVMTRWMMEQKKGDVLGQEKLILGHNVTNYGTSRVTFWNRRIWYWVITRQIMGKNKVTFGTGEVDITP